MGQIQGDQSERIELVDALRGYALFGLLMVHCVERFELYWLNPQPDPWFDAVFALFAGKSFAIFALLFGFGFATIMANHRRRGVNFTARFAWRVSLLFIFGTLHALVYRGDILQVLAVMGFLLIPLDRVRSSAWLWFFAAISFLQLPLILQSILAAQGSAWAQASPIFFTDSGLAALAHGTAADVLAVNATSGMLAKWSFYISTGRMVEIAGLFAAGIALQRSGAFAHVSQARGSWFVALCTFGMVWLAFYRFGSLLIPAWPDQGGAEMQAQSIQWAVGQWSSLAAMGFQVCLFVLLWQYWPRNLLRWFAPPGRMTLTLYIGQSLVAAPFLYGYGLGLWDKLTSAQIVAVGIGFFIAQIALAFWWYRHFRYGPLEWTWRAATMTNPKTPMRR